MSDPLDPHAPEDREHQGEASLGEAQAEDAPNDPEMLEDGDGDQADPGGEVTDVPALDPAPADASAAAAEEAAAAEAGAIGGADPNCGLPEADRPLAEAGEGEAEGFELAEDQLIESASHGDPAGSPIGDRFTAEEAEGEDLASYGEADEEHVSEDTEDDHS